MLSPNERRRWCALFSFLSTSALLSFAGRQHQGRLVSVWALASNYRRFGGRVIHRLTGVLECMLCFYCVIGVIECKSVHLLGVCKEKYLEGAMRNLPHKYWSRGRRGRGRGAYNGIAITVLCCDSYHIREQAEGVKTPQCVNVTFWNCHSTHV